MFLITVLTQGTMGNGIKEEAPALPLFSLLTLFSPLLAFPHSGTPPSASPPLHGLPTPPLSRRERGQTEKCEKRATVHISGSNSTFIREKLSFKWPYDRNTFEICQIALEVVLIV